MKRRFPQNFWTDPAAGLPGDSAHYIELPSKRIQFLEDPAAYIAALVAQETGPATGAMSFGDNAALYVPEKYEAKYPYPLILWLHDSAGNEDDLFNVMPQISDQNYLGLALRGDRPCENHPAGFSWGQGECAAEQFEKQLEATMGELRRTYNVHTERIILAGSGAGATMALRLMLHRPEWFGGAIAFNGEFPEMEHPLANYRELQQKRILLGTGSSKDVVSAEKLIKMSRLLHIAGADVSTRIYETDQRLAPCMLKEVNHWIIDGISQANLMLG